MKLRTFIAGLLILTSIFAVGQTTFQEQAARLQNINGFLLDLRPGTAPIKADRSGVVLSLDLTPQPDVNTRIGNKDEPVDPPSVVPRLRLRFESAIGLFVGGTYVPDMSFQDYSADYYGLELGYRVQLGRFGGTLRVAWLDGEVTGPITEAQAEDLFVFENRGIDLSLGHGLKNFYLYGFVGYGETDTSLDIQLDGVHLDNRGDEGYGGLGVSWRRGHWELVLEQNVTGDYLRHLVLSTGYRF